MVVTLLRWCVCVSLSLRAVGGPLRPRCVELDAELVERSTHVVRPTTDSVARLDHLPPDTDTVALSL